MSSGKMPASSVEKLFSWKRGVSPENVVALREILARARADGGVWDAAAPFIPWLIYAIFSFPEATPT